MLLCGGELFVLDAELAALAIEKSLNWLRRVRTSSDIDSGCVAAGGAQNPAPGHDKEAILVRSKSVRIALAAGAILAFQGASGVASAEDLLGVVCSNPPPLHCVGNVCPADLIANPGNALEPKTGRRFFLDYPCHLKPGEKVTFVLALHGGGLNGNWMRHYFPIMDFKEKYRLVIATPSGSRNGWDPASDDAYLHNIVEEIEGGLGKKNIKAFWLAGHSLGGQTANRLIDNDPFFSKRLTGWVSMSGGRLGSKREDVRAAIPMGASGQTGGPPPLAADASILPEEPFSFIYETGEHELTPAGLPRTSKWAAKLGCKAQAQPFSIIDRYPGYIYDSRTQTNTNPIWGRQARPGSAQVYLYPACAEGRFVADIVRLDKGHTEGLEPQITEAIVKLITGLR
jgi:pimeloyl-ACP methyl ester carboxylesterase